MFIGESMLPDRLSGMEKYYQADVKGGSSVVYRARAGLLCPFSACTIVLFIYYLLIKSQIY